MSRPPGSSAVPSIVAGVLTLAIGAAPAAGEPGTETETDPDTAHPEGQRGESERREEASRRAAAARELDRSSRELEALGLATRRFTPRPATFQLAWDLLSLPQYVVELLFAPIGGLLVVGERYRVPQRVDDLLEITETLSIKPRFKVATDDGLGAGLALQYESPLASQQELEVGGLYQLDGNYELDFEASRRIASLEGRLAEAAVTWEVDQSNNYFGLGSGTDPDDERELGIDDLDASLSLDLNDRDIERYYGTFAVGYVLEKLYPGVGSATPVGDPGDEVAPPPGFDETSHYGRLAIRGTYDSRDTEARTSRGVLGTLEGAITTSLTGESRNALTLRAAGVMYFSILGRSRTLAVSGGAGLAEGITEDAVVPLSGLIVLGRKNFLRGYSKERFRVTRAWWGGVEYEYPIWYLVEAPVVLNATLFVDVAREGSSFADLVETPIRYSYGAGLTLERYKGTLAGFQFGMSPEGPQLILSTGGFL